VPQKLIQTFHDESDFPVVVTTATVWWSQ